MTKKGTTKPDDQMHARYRKMRVNGKQVNVCRYVLEQKIGRPLEPGEYAHHINGNKLDDRPENLEVVTPKLHSTIHNSGRHPSEETRKKLSEASKGRPGPWTGKHRSPEYKQKLSETMKG